MFTLLCFSIDRCSLANFWLDLSKSSILNTFNRTLYILQAAAQQSPTIYLFQCLLQELHHSQNLKLTTTSGALNLPQSTHRVSKRK